MTTSTVSAAPAPGPSFMIAAGNFFFRTRNVLFPLAFVVIALATRPRAFLGLESADFWMNVAGVLIAVAGQALRVAVIGLAYIRRGGKEGRIHADDLVVEGFFAHSRNPLYVGNMMVYLGLLVVLNSPAGWLVGAPFYFFAYWAITLAEEDFLLRKFGAVYDEYRRRVNRFIPRLAGLGATMRSMRFDWRRVVHKEYGSTFSWITTMLALFVWERVARHGTAGLGSTLVVVLAVWALAILGYGTARYLKKTRRLEQTA